jgi:ATP-dependent Clp protease adaptor protein ClpS
MTGRLRGSDMIDQDKRSGLGHRDLASRGRTPARQASGAPAFEDQAFDHGGQGGEGWAPHTQEDPRAQDPGGQDPGGPGQGGGQGGNDGASTGVVVKPRPRTRKPAMYKVLMLNDDYTPMEFVVHVLERFFQKNREEATQIMLHVHRRGVGVCGVFTYEVAETKVTQVMDLARQNQHPLQCTIEKE